MRPLTPTFMLLAVLLLRAIQMRASDLHLEPLQKRLRVRVRVDGVLQNLNDLPAAPQVEQLGASPITYRSRMALKARSMERLNQPGSLFTE